MIDAEREAASLQILITEAPLGEQELLQHMIVDDLSPTEAARAIGISSGAGRVRLSRLRSRIAQAEHPRASTEANSLDAAQLEERL